jgi:hypothetical protein
MNCRYLNKSQGSRTIRSLVVEPHLALKPNFIFSGLLFIVFTRCIFSREGQVFLLSDVTASEYIVSSDLRAHPFCNNNRDFYLNPLTVK